MSAASSQIRILAVDDHALVREGIAGLVSVQPDMVVARVRRPPVARPSSNSGRSIRTSR